MGYVLEQSLAVNVEGKGIVLIIGYGHQTIEKIIERAQELFDEPIYCTVVEKYEVRIIKFLRRG